MKTPLAASLNRGSPPGFRAVGTLVAGLLITLAVALWLRGEARENDATRLHEDAVLQKEALETRLELFVLLLRHLADRAGREPGLTPERWDELVRNANVAGEFPGLAAVGFTRLAPREGKGPTHPAWWAALGLATPTNGMTKLNRATGDTLHTLIRPLPQGPETFMHTNAGQPTEQQWGRIVWAVEVAPAATPAQPVHDAARGSNDVGFRVIVGAFSPQRHPHQLVKERHTAASATNKALPHLGHFKLDNEWGHAVGVVYGDFAARQFVESTLGKQPRTVGFSIWDAPGEWRTKSAVPLNPVYLVAPESPPYLEERLEVKHYGRRLLLDFFTTPEFEAHSLQRWPRHAGILGSTITLLAAGLVFMRERGQARERADAQELRAAHQRLQNAQRERERLNRDLHDTVIQSVYAAGLGLQSARRILGQEPERASERLTEVMSELNGIIARLRGYIQGEATPAPHSLAARLEEALAPFRREAGSALTLRADEATSRPEESGSLEHIVNIVREAVSNAVRHANATAIDVQVERSGTALVAEVQDNGIGFNPAGAVPGEGLRNIRERTAELGGILHLHSAPGHGTLLRVMIPLQTGRPVQHST